MFEGTWLTNFGVTDPECQWWGCDRVNGEDDFANEDGGDDDDGDSRFLFSSAMIIIIGAAVGVIAIVGLVICLMLRLRGIRRNAVEEMSIETDAMDDLLCALYNEYD